MGWDVTKHEPMLLEYVGIKMFFNILGYEDESINPVLSGSDFCVCISWQGRSVQLRIGTIGTMPESQLKHELCALSTDWNLYASQLDRDQVWQASQAKKRASTILLGLKNAGFPHTVTGSSKGGI